MPRNRLFWFRNPSVESCVFGNLRSAWSYGDNLTIQCFFFFLTKKGLWPHSLGNGLSSKAFEDCLSERLNEMQNGSRTGPVLLREHVPVLGESHCRVLHIFFSSELFKRSPLVSAYFFFFFLQVTYMATSSNLFQMDLVIEWLIIHSVVSYVVKLRNLQQTGLEPCFMVSGRKDNP